MEKVKEIINASWFRAALFGLIGIILLTEKNPLYAGIAFGIGLREFFLTFKNDKKEEDVTKKSTKK